MATTQEILRSAATIVDTSWSAEHDALDADGNPVPLYIAGVGETTRAELGAVLGLWRRHQGDEGSAQGPLEHGQRHPGPPKRWLATNGDPVDDVTILSAYRGGGKLIPLPSERPTGPHSRPGAAGQAASPGARPEQDGRHR